MSDRQPQISRTRAASKAGGLAYLGGHSKKGNWQLSVGVLCAVAFLVQSLLTNIFPVKASVQSGYRWRNDDGTESTATYSRTENAPITSVPKNTTERLRFGVANSGSESELLEKANLAFASGENNLTVSVIDTTNGYAYFAANTSPGKIIKVRLSDFTEVGTLTVTSGTIFSGVIDPANGFAYFGTADNPATIYKVTLGAGNAAPTQTASITLTTTTEQGLATAVIDNVNHFAYFATETTSNPEIIKINTSPAGFAKTGFITINNASENDWASSVIDVANGFAYFASPFNKVTKVDLSTFTRVGVVSTTEGILNTGVIDTVNGFAYFGGNGSPAKIVKINLSTFTRVGALTLASGENNVGSSVIDPVNGFAYFGTIANADGKVAKVNLSTFLEVTPALTFSSGETKAQAGVIDVANGYAYFGNSTSPGKVIKVSIAPRAQFRLEYGAKATTCAAISSWTQVAASPTTEHWAMSDSANVTNAAASTNSAGLTDANTSFKAGYIHDTTSQTASLSLGEKEFSELEYAIKATNNATDSGNYCFRLTDAGTPLTAYTNYAEARLTTESSDLSLSKIVSNATPGVGTNVTYTVTVTNGGPSANTNVAVTDLLPAGVTYVSSTPSQGSYVSGTGVWTVGSMAYGATATLQVVASVNSGTANTTITNTAEVTAADVTDPDSTPNNHDAGEDDQASVNIVPVSSDLSLTNTVDNAAPSVGNNVTFTVTVSNAGPTNATNVAAKDLLPTGLTYVSSTPSQGSYVSGTGIWTIGSIASGASKNITITASVNTGEEGSTFTTTAQVTASDQSDPDSTPNNNNAGEDDQASRSVTVATVIPTLTRSIPFTSSTGYTQQDSSKTEFKNGAVQIGADQTVGGVTSVASVVSSTGFSTVSDALSVPATGTITSWRVYSVNNTNLKLKAYLRNGANNYTLRADSSLQAVTATSVNGPFSTSMSVVSGDKIGMYGANNPISTTGNGNTFLWTGTDFSGTGSFSNFDSAHSQPNIEFTLTTFSTAQDYYVTTTDTTHAKTRTWTGVTGVTFTQTTPTNTSIKYLVSFDGRTTWKYWNGSAWTNSTLAAIQTNGNSKATLEGLSSGNWSSANGFVAGTTVGIDVAVDLKTTSNTVTPSVDDISFTYTSPTDYSINFSPASEANYFQADAANTDFVAGSVQLHPTTGGSGTPISLSGGSGGQSGQTTYTAPDGTTVVSSVATWNNGSLYYMQYLFDGSGLVGTPTDTQIWLGSGPSCSTGAPCTMVITLPAARALDHIVVYPYARSADWSEYTIAVSPDGTANSWTFVAGSGSTSTGVGTSFTHTSQGSAGDNFSYSSVGTYKVIKFSLTKQGTNGPALDEIQLYPTATTYTTTGKTVTTLDASHLNTTSWTAVGGVHFTQTLPDSSTLKYLVSFDGRTTWKYWNGTAWTTSAIGSIGTNGNDSTTMTALGWDDWQSTGGFVPGTTTSLDFAVELKTPTNTVTPSLDQITVDYSTLAYNPTADLSLGKTVSNGAPHEGDSISYTVSATNSGPNVTTNVAITDLLPSGVTYVSSTPSQGSYVNGTGLWTVGTVESGQVVSMTINATVNAGTGGTTATNTAQVSASDQTDPDSTPNNNNASEDDQASAVIHVVPLSADLSLTKSVNAPGPNVGQNVTYTVTAHNSGPDGATGVIVKDLLPSGVTYVSSSPSQGTYNSATGGWTIGSVASGATKTLTITASVDSGTGGTTITNTAQVIASDQADPDSTPNNNNAGEDDQASRSITVQSADLSVTKSVNDTTPNVGQNVTFTVTVHNSGPDAATGVSVKDLLPAGLTYASSSPSQGSYASSTGTWTVGTVANGTTKTLSITASVDAGTGNSLITNAAQVLASDTFDPDSTPNNNNLSEDDEAVVVLDIQSADLSLTKTVNNASPAESDSITYTVTLSNAGPDSATGVSVKDLLPSGLTYASSSPSQGSYASGTGTWTVGTIADGASKTLTITATVNSGTAGTTATNTAQVFLSDTSDPDSTPNNSNAAEDDQASRAITVANLTSDLSLTKTVDNATPTEGATVIYTITVTNGGPNAAANVAVKDNLPSGVTYVSDTPSQGTYSSGTGIWTIGSIANGASKTLAIHATVDSGTTGTTITNTAQVSASDSIDNDSTPNNNNAGEDDQASASITVGQADLSLTKTVDEATPSVGGTIVYTVTVTNSGPADAAGVIAKDLLPAGVTYVSDSPSQGTYVSGSGFWTIGAIADGASKTLTITATVNAGTAETSIDNVAQITSSNQPDPDSTPNNNDASEDDEADAAIVVNATAANTDRISVSDGEAQAGNNSGLGVDGVSISADGNIVAFTSSATNLVSGDTNGVQDIFVRDRAAGTTVIASVMTDGTQSAAASNQPHLSADGRYVAFTSSGNLVAGDTTGLDVFRRDLQTNTTVLASPNANGSANSSGNNPSISGDGRYVAYDTNTAGNFTGDTNGLHDVFRRDMISNTTIRVSLRPGGAQTSNGDSINPSISRDGRYIAYESDDTGIVSGDNASQRDIFVYDVQNGTTVRASLTSTNGEPNDDCLNASISGDGRYVAFESDATNIVAGDTNAGRDIFVRDLVGGTTTRVSVGTGGTQGDGTGVLGADNAHLANDGRFVIFRSGSTNLVPGDTNNKLDIFVHDQQTGGTYRASVASDGTQGNDDSNIGSAINDDDPISVFSSNSSNLVPGDSNGAADVFMNEQGESEADLSLTKTVDNATPLIGDTVTYTITVTDSGPVDATSVTVNDVLPAGVTYVSHTPSQGTWFHAGGNNNGDWVIGTITAGTSATLVIHATVDAGRGGQTITNTAQVTVSGVADPDSTPNNSNASEDDQDSVSITVEGASDLSLTKIVSNNAPLIGQNFTYTISVHNAGPDAASHVTVHDALSGNLTYVSDTPSQGTWFHNGGNNDGDWVFGTPLASGGNATLVITAKPNSHTGGFTITNTAQVKASDQTDPDSTPNNSNAGEDDQASASLTVEGSSDLSVNKTVDNASPNVSDPIVYTVTVSNAGPDQATNVTVHDPLPGGLTYVSDTPSQGTWFHSGGNNNGDWVLGTPLNSGATATLTIHATVNTGTGGATITNTAQVSAVDQNDPDSTPNNNNAGEDDQHSVSITVAGTPTTADLSLTKTVNDPTPLANDTVIYTVTVTNHGPLSDSGITVSDPIPTGETYVSDTPSQGSYVSGTGVWTVGSLGVDASATLQIHAHIDASAAGTTITNTAEVTAAAVTDFDSTPNNHNADEDDQASVSFDVPAASANSTEGNSVALSRLKTGATATATVNFTLVDTLSGTLTVTFADDFTILTAPTSGTCSGGGTLDTFGFSNSTKTMTAEKHQCSGTVTLSGGTVVNPPAPGPYRIDWVNDDPGFAIVAITSDDQIFVTASVNPYITFQVTTDHSGANAACDHGTDGDSQDHTPNTDGGVVQLGLLDSTTVASSDTARNGAAADDGDSDASPVTAGTDVQHICTFVSTNAGGGYAITVQSENGALASDSTPGDTIPETPQTGAAASVTPTPGEEHYAMCLSTADAPSMDASTPVGTNLIGTAPYAPGSCTGVNTPESAGTLTTSPNQIGSSSGPVQEGTATWLIKTSIDAATKAHADYDDTLTFIATGSF